MIGPELVMREENFVYITEHVFLVHVFQLSLALYQFEGLKEDLNVKWNY